MDNNLVKFIDDMQAIATKFDVKIPATVIHQIEHWFLTDYSPQQAFNTYAKYYLDKPSHKVVVDDPQAEHSVEAAMEAYTEATKNRISAQKLFESITTRASKLQEDEKPMDIIYKENSDLRIATRDVLVNYAKYYFDRVGTYPVVKAKITPVLTEPLDEVAFTVEVKVDIITDKTKLKYENV